MKRICKRCDEKFEHTSKYNKICEACILEAKKRVKENREEIQKKQDKSMKRLKEIIEISKLVAKRKKQVKQ